MASPCLRDEARRQSHGGRGAAEQREEAGLSLSDVEAVLEPPAPPFRIAGPDQCMAGALRSIFQRLSRAAPAGLGEEVQNDEPSVLGRDNPGQGRLPPPSRAKDAPVLEQAPADEGDAATAIGGIRVVHAADFDVSLGGLGDKPAPPAPEEGALSHGGAPHAVAGRANRPSGMSAQSERSNEALTSEGQPSLSRSVTANSKASKSSSSGRSRPGSKKRVGSKGRVGSKASSGSHWGLGVRRGSAGSADDRDYRGASKASNFSMASMLSSMSQMLDGVPKPRASLMSWEMAIAASHKHELGEVDEEEADEEKAHEPQGTIMGAYVTMVLTCMGSTLILTPGIMATSGFVGGLCVLVLPAVLSALTLRMLVRLADAASQGDYSSVIYVFLGDVGRGISFWSLVALLPLIAASCMAFAVEVVPLMVPAVSPLMAGGISIVLAMPLAFAKTLSHLRYASTFALVALAYTVLLVIVQALSNGEVHHSVAPFAPPSMLGVSLAQGLSAFGAELSVIQCYIEIPKDQRPKFTHRVIDASMVTILLLYLVVGWFGYVLFGSDVQSNILMNMQGDAWSMVAQGVVVFSNLLRAPIFAILLFVTVTSRFGQQFRRCTQSSVLRAAFQGGGVALAGVLAVTMGKVGIVIALAGGTGAVALCQMLPSIAWIAARRAGKVEKSLAVDAGAICMTVGSPLFSIYFGVNAVLQWNNI